MKPTPTNREQSRTIIGIMSGTSLDGIDAVLAQISGTGLSLKIKQLGFISAPYRSDLKSLLLKNSFPDTSDVQEISQLNVRLAHEYAKVVYDLLQQSDIDLQQVDAIGSHGQTIYHVPVAADCAGLPIRSTLQIGDPSTLAQLVHKTVVGDFRLADMAVGGQGAPLASYFDYAYFSHQEEARALLNIGGIANMTVLPANASAAEVFAFDTGPGNMIMDSLARQFWGVPYDEGGTLAAKGSVDSDLLSWLMDDPYYTLPPPKTTGREVYTRAYVDNLLQKANTLGVSSNEDVVRTVTQFTVDTIGQSYDLHIKPKMNLDRIIVSGGGIHNACLMDALNERIPSAHIDTLGEHGVDPDAKEALFFAVFAHETLNGIPSNLPAATGATRPAIMGKICLPG
ncbi:MAG: anhydro-N-acetylmuramic acid kinase [Rhodothermaceae bacterium]|nr:anhydro-N-acetylmuramic acid kinase [Rhodothermaceae bacterium]